MSISVLIYENRKQDPDIYDVSTPEKEAAAYLKLFNYLRLDWQVYSDIEEAPEPLKTCEPCGKDLHRLCEGNCACEATDDCKKKSRQTRRYRDTEATQKTLYDKAKAGDAAAAKRLLHMRKSYEYENFSFGEVIDPLEGRRK